MNLWFSYLWRGLVALLALLVAHWSAGPITRSFLQRSAPRTLGFQLTIDKASVSPLVTEMELETVCLPHPDLPRGKWLECQRIWLDVEGGPLLRKKLVIRNARAIGARLHDPTKNESFAEQDFTRPTRWELELQARRALEAAFTQANTALQPNGVTTLPSDSLLKEMSTTWTNGLLELDNEFTVYELRAERLAELPTARSEEAQTDETEEAEAEEAEADESPTETEQLKQTIQEIRTLEQEMLAFRKRVAALQTRREVDQQRLRNAQADDLNQLQQPPRVRLPGNQTLSCYFLGSVSTERAWEVVRLIQAARAFLRRGKQTPITSQAFGLTFDFPRENSTPTFLLKALHFDGTGEFGGQSVRFAGSLQNLTNNPRASKQPTRLVIDAHVPHRIVIEAVLDQSQVPPQEHVVIRCPNWPRPARTLGVTEQVAIAASSSVLSMRAELFIADEQVTGTVQTRHQKIALKPRIAAAWGGARVADSLNERLGTIQTLDSMVTLQGPLSCPEIELKSPLGEQLVGGLQHGFEQELAHRQRQRIADWRSRQKTTFDELQTKLAAGQQRLVDRMSETGGQVRALAGKVREQYPELVKRLAKPRSRVAKQSDAERASPKQRK